MDLHSRDDLLRRMPARGALVGLLERDDDFLIERVRFDPLDGRSPDGAGRCARRARTALSRLARNFAGFRPADWRPRPACRVEAHGQDGEPLRFDSRRLVMVAHR
jgi:hypothetical protein